MNQDLDNYLKAVKALWDHIEQFEGAELKNGVLVARAGKRLTREDMEKTVQLSDEATRLRDIWLEAERHLTE